MKVGIDRIACYTPAFYLDLKTLASLYEKDPAGYYDVLGQEKMSVPAPDEDTVTLAANAAWQILKEQDLSNIKCLYFATESGIDQSKAAGMYLHKLLGLPSDCRVIEVKQACYSGTFALRSAYQHVQLNPDQECLVVASDIARYGLGSPGEPTQGAGAVAMLVKQDPAVCTLSSEYGVYAEDAMDFWRPNYKDEAFVDGQYSVRLYLKTMLHAWANFQEKTNAQFSQYKRFCFHLPFSTIAEKAYGKLAKKSEVVVSDQDLQEAVHTSLNYNRLTGNCYTASLYQSLCSLMDNDSADLSKTDIAMFSYGSGSMAEFFTVNIQEGYKDALLSEAHQNIFNNRKELDYKAYQEFYNFSLPRDGQDLQCPRLTMSRFRLAGMKKHKRIYETQRQID